VGRFLAQGEQDGGANSASPHPPPTAPTTPTPAPAHAGAAHCVGEEVFVLVFVARSMIVWVWHLFLLEVSRPAYGLVHNVR
jgi:hypothetical protein